MSARSVDAHSSVEMDRLNRFKSLLQDFQEERLSLEERSTRFLLKFLSLPENWSSLDSWSPQMAYLFTKIATLQPKKQKEVDRISATTQNFYGLGPDKMIDQCPFRKEAMISIESKEAFLNCLKSPDPKNWNINSKNCLDLLAFGVHYKIPELAIASENELLSTLSKWNSQPFSLFGAFEMARSCENHTLFWACVKIQSAKNYCCEKNDEGNPFSLKNTIKQLENRGIYFYELETEHIKLISQAKSKIKKLETRGNRPYAKEALERLTLLINEKIIFAPPLYLEDLSDLNLLYAYSQNHPVKQLKLSTSKLTDDQLNEIAEKLTELEILTLDVCSSVTKIPSLLKKRLKGLTVENSPIASLNLPLVKELYLKNCPRLVKIKAPNLRLLTGIDCPEMEQLDLMKVEQVRLNKWPKLNSASLPNVIFFDGRSLAGIKKLDFPSGKKIYLSSLPLVEEIVAPAALKFTFKKGQKCAKIALDAAQNILLTDLSALKKISLRACTRKFIAANLPLEEVRVDAKKIGLKNLSQCKKIVADNAEKFEAEELALIEELNLPNARSVDLVDLENVERLIASQAKVWAKNCPKLADHLSQYEWIHFSQDSL